MARIFVVFLLLFPLISCDMGAEFEQAKKNTAQASELIKTELKVEPFVTWNRETNFNESVVEVTVEFEQKDVKSIDIKKLESISRKAVLLSFKIPPDEIIVSIVSSE